MNKSYGDKEYWDKRYKKALNSSTPIYDWYTDYVRERIEKDDDVLVIGCGNSQLSEDMYLDGYKKITSVDYSKNVIDLMKSRAYERRYDLLYLEMDARNLNFGDETMDIVFDKGTIDALMCGNDSEKNCDELAREAYRVLKHGGTMICVSYGIPSSRIEIFDKPYLNWKIHQERIEKHFVYRMVKDL